MGVLGVNGSGNGEQHIDAPEPEEAAPVSEGQPRDDAGQFVPAEKLVPESPASRRDRLWQERVAAATKPIEERFTNELKTRDEQLAQERQARSEHSRELARLQGMIEAMQRQPAQQQTPQAQGPDPDKLFAEADEALTRNDINGYHAKQRAGYVALAAKQAKEAAAEVRQEMQRQQASQLPPHIQSLLMQHPNVASAGQKGAREVLRAEEDLADEGMAQGYARTQKAFQVANEKLAPKTKPTAPSYSRESAAALSVPPTGRPGPAGGRAEGDGVRLNEAQMVAMKAGGFKDAADYLKWSDPHKHGMVKQ